MKCPKCGSIEVETLNMVDIIDCYDEDDQLKYYTATSLYNVTVKVYIKIIYEAACLDCGEVFTYEGDYTERKHK